MQLWCSGSRSLACWSDMMMMRWRWLGWFCIIHNNQGSLYSCSIEPLHCMLSRLVITGSLLSESTKIFFIYKVAFKSDSCSHAYISTLTSPHFKRFLLSLVTMHKCIIQWMFCRAILISHEMYRRHPTLI